MTQTVLVIMAIAAGMSIAIQASINAMMGQLAHNTFLSLTIAFTISALFSAMALWGFSERSTLTFSNLPGYFWLIAGVFTSFGVGTMYFLIPKLGIGQVMAYALTGQLIGAMIINHFGVLGSPAIALNSYRLLGAGLLISGVFLINMGARQ
ncbi:DMT family transporter [Idiomarina aminovorans]|uniref:DMT family transporter n=1 Tax=Idiomarina aminovorans TaxID=2914829 RepID=UPI0020035385|nr:DMT family transporter [Idiomarina sp. ATCH4]MCK7459444.1 DMT family transporter [Idiomarina sp. ATCH4]